MAFLGSEALAADTLNRYQLRTRYDALYRNVYVPRGAVLTPRDKAVAAWLWSGRRGVAAGLSAAALHGSKWIEAKHPAELIQDSRSGPVGIVIHSDKLWPDEVTVVRGVPATSLARTAFDLGRRMGNGEEGVIQAVIRVDAMLQATALKMNGLDPLLLRHKGVRGMCQLRRVLDLADDGAESPQETRLRLLLTWAGLRPSHTQINVYDGYALVGRLDMGYPEWKVGVQYDGAQHWEDPRQRALDIEQDVAYRDLGWRIVRVGADLIRNRQATIIRRVRAELRAAGAPC